MSKADANFDTRAGKFASNIYGTSKGKIREAVLWRAIQPMLNQLPAETVVLDAGGGQGQLARRVANSGFQLVLTDISSEMLSLAKEQVIQAGLEHRFQYLQCAIQDLSAHLDQQFDAVMCHAVLEWVTEPKACIDALAERINQDGWLSLAFYNHRGAEFHNLVSGNFDNVGESMTNRRTKRVRLVPNNPLHNEQVRQWLIDANFEIIEQVGVRVIHDYLRDKSMQQSQFERLLELELAYCAQPIYRDMGRYTHFLARKRA